MDLVKLEIERGWRRNEKNRYTGKISFDNEHGMVSLNLTPEHIEDIFSLCADAIVETAKTAAKDMTVAVIEHQKSIEDGV